jgi:histidinol-phosphate aminotransferase
MKDRSHIARIFRPRPEAETRLGKTRLDKNERIAPFPENFWKSVLTDITQELIQACPEVWPLYQKLSSFHNISPDRILLTAGSETAIRHSIEAFAAPGEKVIYPDPTFAMVSVYCDLYGVEKVPVKYDKHLILDVSYLLNSLDQKTSLLILANPNSPTGTYVPNAVVVTILKKAASLGIVVLIDEAYFGFCRETAVHLLNDYKNLIVTRSFSKLTGMAGLRVGYVLGHPETIALMTKYRPMYEVNSVGILFACKILDNWHIAEEYGRQTIEGKKKFVYFLKQSGFKVLKTETNFIHVDFGSSKEAILGALAAKGILVRGMLDIDGYENYIRFSVGPKESMEPVMETIYDFVKKSHSS